MSNQCIDCRFYLRDGTDEPGTEVGSCRRYAPRPDTYVSPRWPIVADSDWCGDFEKKSGRHRRRIT